jgi:hypothetical protein
MAKGGRVSLGNNGGIAGSGVFGLFGSIVTCKSDDNSYYCLFVKFFNILIMTALVIYILYIIYYFVFPLLFSKKRK